MVSESNFVLAHFVITFIYFLSFSFFFFLKTKRLQWRALDSRWRQTPTFALPFFCFRHVMNTDYLLKGYSANRLAGDSSGCSFRWSQKQINSCCVTPVCAGVKLILPGLDVNKLCASEGSIFSAVAFLLLLLSRRDRCCVNTVSTTTLTRHGIQFQSPQRPTVPSYLISFYFSLSLCVFPLPWHMKGPVCVGEWIRFCFSISGQTLSTSPVSSSDAR